MLMNWFGKRSSLNFYVVALVFLVTIINVFFSFHNQAFNGNTFTYQEQATADFSVVSDLLEDEDENLSDEEVGFDGNFLALIHPVLSLDPHLHHWIFSPFVKEGIQPVAHALFLTLRKLLI